MLQRSGKPIVLCVNKCDTVGGIPAEFYEFYNLGLGDPIAVSAAHGHGTGDLLDAVFEHLNEYENNEDEDNVINVAIIGKPNAGKSSFVNKVLGEDRLIVSNIAGTTRDAIDTKVEVGDQKYNLIDTAGLRRQSKVIDKIEKYSVLRAKMAIDRSDVCVIMLDAVEGFTEQDSKVAGLALEQGVKKGRTRFVTTRFGNVLGSNGSVIPRFREQISKGGPITVTHPDITRFFMTIPEACRLVMEAATMSAGNQIYVFDMGESVKISTLAKRMIQLAGLTLGKDIQIEYTGLRPGEKLYEEVLSNAENTDPTSHDRIRVAHVREYDYAEASELVAKLETLSRAVEVESMVMLMKNSVPEFISKNSRFEKFDKKVG
jgi:small GTP-binding protein